QLDAAFVSDACRSRRGGDLLVGLLSRADDARAVGERQRLPDRPPRSSFLPPWTLLLEQLPQPNCLLRYNARPHRRGAVRMGALRQLLVGHLREPNRSSLERPGLTNVVRNVLRASFWGLPTG